MQTTAGEFDAPMHSEKSQEDGRAGAARARSTGEKQSSNTPRACASTHLTAKLQYASSSPGGWEQRGNTSHTALGASGTEPLRTVSRALHTTNT